jgi:hypothetical protein
MSPCPLCKSNNQAEFPTEMLVHFGGLKNLDKPSVWVYPELLVCLECGFAQATIPASELAQLASGTSTRARAAGDEDV